MESSIEIEWQGSDNEKDEIAHFFSLIYVPDGRYTEGYIVYLIASNCITHPIHGIIYMKYVHMYYAHTVLNLVQPVVNMAN